MNSYAEFSRRGGPRRGQSSRRARSREREASEASLNEFPVSTCPLGQGRAYLTRECIGGHTAYLAREHLGRTSSGSSRCTRAAVHEYMHERRDRDVFYIREFGYLCVTAEVFAEHVPTVRV